MTYGIRRAIEESVTRAFNERVRVPTMAGAADMYLVSGDALDRTLDHAYFYQLDVGFRHMVRLPDFPDAADTHRYLVENFSRAIEKALYSDIQAKLAELHHELSALHHTLPPNYAGTITGLMGVVEKIERMASLS